MNERELIHEMKKKKKYETYLDEYTSRFCGMYYEYASIQLAFSYYTVFEVLSEEVDIDFAKPIMQELTDALKLEGDDAIEAIKSLRNKVMETMDNVTLYTDMLGIYEHIMNRVEYRYKSDLVTPDLSVASTRIQQFIFADKDAVVTNDKIKSIVSELPLRMTKQRFYDILSDSLGIYKDSDEAGVNGFVYMLRTIAGLKRDFKAVEGLQELESYITSVENTDFKNLSETEFNALLAKLQSATENLTQIVNIYMQLQECINHFYTMLLCKPYVTSFEQASEDATQLMVAIRDHVTEDPETVLNSLTTYLEALEGRQESVMERVMEYEALLSDVAAEHQDNAAIQALVTSGKLVSSSIFIDLNEEEESVPVTPEFLQNATAELLKEFADYFANHSMIVNRAVMSRILGAVPVFFNTADEIKEYINYALTHCSDQAELCASLDLINQIME